MEEKAQITDSGQLRAGVSGDITKPQTGRSEWHAAVTMFCNFAQGPQGTFTVFFFACVPCNAGVLLEQVTALSLGPHPLSTNQRARTWLRCSKSFRSIAVHAYRSFFTVTYLCSGAR
eukprot:TRINITY_DN105387_c0_g1_i1.p1 TRINITY_DN105387_c0_g1~~TRINITY_DN105387_c0_g1_i1.p1  ORF type:complete len:126 (-),score=0.34 TRINITY_DN105387_c0_g1_i1:49-399(-)